MSTTSPNHYPDPPEDMQPPQERSPFPKLKVRPAKYAHPDERGYIEGLSAAATSAKESLQRSLGVRQVGGALSKTRPVVDETLVRRETLFILMTDLGVLENEAAKTPMEVSRAVSQSKENFDIMYDQALKEYREIEDEALQDLRGRFGQTPLMDTVRLLSKITAPSNTLTFLDNMSLIMLDRFGE